MAADGIDPRVGEVAAVDAQVEVGVGDQALHLVGELDVAAGVRVDHGSQPVRSGDGRDPVDDVEHRRPPIVGQPGRDVGPSRGGHARLVRPVDDDEHRAAGRGDRPAGPLGDGEDRLLLGRVVEVLEDVRAHRGEVATAQLGSQRGRVLGQVADRPQLQCAEPGRLDLVEDVGPGRVARTVGEVDAPGDGPRGQLDGQRVGGVVVHGQ